MEYKGKVVAVMPETQVSEKFKKREFVISDENQQYPQEVIFEMTQDRTNLLDLVKIGDIVTVHFNLRGRAWKNPQGQIKYFNTLQAFKVVSESKAATHQAQVASPQTQEEDLPF
jgi:hypothetical protein